MEKKKTSEDKKTSVPLIAFAVVAAVIAVVCLVIAVTHKPGESSGPAEVDPNPVTNGTSVITFNVGGSSTAHVTHTGVVTVDDDKVDAGGNVVVDNALAPWQKTIYVNDLKETDLMVAAEFDEPAFAGEQRFCLIRVNDVVLADSSVPGGMPVDGDTVRCEVDWKTLKPFLTPQDKPSGELTGPEGEQSAE